MKKTINKVASKSTITKTKKRKISKTALRAAWVEALRSGNYKRTTGALSEDGKYCCLGVACEVYNKLIPDKLEIGNSFYNRKTYDNAVTLLPEKVKEAFGFNSFDGRFEESNENFALAKKVTKSTNECTLATLNDSGGTFKKIADLIELEPKGLFTSKSKK